MVEKGLLFAFSATKDKKGCFIQKNEKIDCKPIKRGNTAFLCYTDIRIGEYALMVIDITTEYIELQQLMKLTGWISTGGEAKIAVKRYDIKLNGEKENRRGKKIYPGDVVEINGKKYEVRACI